MAVGNISLPDFHTVAGFRLGITSAGIKTLGRPDLVIMELAAGGSLAGVFTQNAFCAAPVTLAKAHLTSQTEGPRYLLINTGNANAGTGAQGMANASACCDALAQLSAVPATSILPFSTGVIGEPLPVAKIFAGIPSAFGQLSEGGWTAAASAIMTTDTRPKGATLKVELGDEVVHISGISKGAGMICPNMATMLAFVATDAAVAETELQSLLARVADRTFNRITIDGDTSTNDACMLAATGQSGVALSPAHPHWPAFADAIETVLRELAQAIVKDGEGATKFVTVQVEQAASQDEALQTAYTIAHSPLVKTALFASDPNWGRILACVGRAGITDLDLQALQIYLNDVCIVENGGRSSRYTEEQGQSVMDGESILIRVVLGRGDFAEQIWTTDLSHDYVSINADYRS